MTVQVKICGISSEADYNICRAAGASWTGMVYYPGSSRHLTLAQLARLAACDTSADAPQRVLLTVDVIGDALAPLIAAAKPDMLQLHGRETPAEVAAIKQHFKLPVIKAIPIETAADLGQCTAWHGLADWLLFDAKTSLGQQPGGTGHSFDWTVLAGYRGPTAWMLAGGLDASTVSRAVAISQAQAVDVSSGVESQPGKKDPNAIHAFIRAAQLV